MRVAKAFALLPLALCGMLAFPKAKADSRGSEADVVPGFYRISGPDICGAQFGAVVFVPHHGRRLITPLRRYEGTQLRRRGAELKIAGSPCSLRMINNELGTLGVRARLLSHRGDSRVAPANTIPAFDAAMRQGYAGVELDVWISRDGVAFVSHDDQLRVATTCGGRISKRRSEEIRTCTVVRSPLLPESRFLARKAREPSRIPSLGEVMQRYLPDPRVHQIVVDIKPAAASPTIASALERAVAKAIPVRQTKLTFITQNLDQISLIRRSFPKAHIALESNRTVSGLIDDPGDHWEDQSFDTFSISFNSLFDPKLKVIKFLRGENLTPRQRFLRFYQRNAQSTHPKRLLVWTVNSKAGLAALHHFNFDDVLTDVPYEEAVALLMRSRPRHD